VHILLGFALKCGWVAGFELVEQIWAPEINWREMLSWACEKNNGGIKYVINRAAQAFIGCSGWVLFNVGLHGDPEDIAAIANINDVHVRAAYTIAYGDVHDRKRGGPKDLHNRQLEWYTHLAKGACAIKDPIRKVKIQAILAEMYKAVCKRKNIQYRNDWWCCLCR